MTTAAKALYQACMPLGILLVGVSLVWGFGIPWRETLTGTNLPLAVNAVWHFAAAYLFMGFAGPVIALNTTDRPIPQLGVEAMQFLGGMNAAVSAFAVMAIGFGIQPLAPALVFFALANFSQFACDVKLHRTGRTTNAFYQITIGDALVCLMNLAYLWA